MVAIKFYRLSLLLLLLLLVVVHVVVVVVGCCWLLSLVFLFDRVGRQSWSAATSRSSRPASLFFLNIFL